MDGAKEKLLWYYDNLNKEGQKTLLNIARAFVGTGTFARLDELRAETQEYIKSLDSVIDKQLPDYLRNEAEAGEGDEEF